MTDLFQLDESESLDFGIYRIIRRHNREVRDFLGEIIVEKERKTLQGGRLSELLEAAFAVADAEEEAGDRFRIGDNPSCPPLNLRGGTLGCVLGGDFLPLLR
jgi:adenine-specific DNA-methyltransferase